ncbi:hypothetical protein ACFPM7_04655 [Actinokineospora guangxiensis]|uniref:DUF5709 domain-containing protein n=1 Tax=Actinokineospora guangxiensis TaxID=1490288 RepID=A0ABW0EG30_9PSEU
MSTDRSQAESLDEETIGLDPLEEGADPTERWAEATRHGTTPSEAREGEPLDSRLAQEEPDVVPVPDAERPVAEVPSDIDRYEGATEEVPPADRTGLPPDAAAARGQTADEAGGSVAESLREDHPNQ